MQTTETKQSATAPLIAKRHKGKFSERRKERRAKRKEAAKQTTRSDERTPLERRKEKKAARAMLKEWAF